MGSSSLLLGWWDHVGSNCGECVGSYGEGGMRLVVMVMRAWEAMWYTVAIHSHTG